jgi:uncharacterized glyoxalase superfamily protein PhnB
MISASIFVLAVPDLARSSAWYRDVLGFEIHAMSDPGWRMMIRDGCTIMAGECRDALPPSELGDQSYFAYLIVDNIEVLHLQFVGNGAEIIKALKTEPWGMREFGVRTIDGHRMMLGQKTAPAP